MIILWDEPKRNSNLDKHGFDFEGLDHSYFEAAIYYPVKFGRVVAINYFQDQKVAVIFKSLGREAITVISMRIASKKERKLLK